MADIATLVIGTIFEHLAGNGLFTVPEIVEKTGISMTTISKYVSSMLEKGILEAKDTVRTGSRGRQAILYGLKGEQKYLLGVDVKTDSLIMSLMDTGGKILRTETDRDFSYQNTDENLERACKTIEEFISQTRDSFGGKVIQMCMTIGGRVNAEAGTSASNYNVEGLGESSLASFLEERFGFKVRIENDTKAMAYGEYLKLREKGVSDLLFINVGWGLGMGIVLDGKLHYGKDGYSGELGHIPAYDNGILCHCGKMGCLETEVSGRAIQRKLKEQISAGKNSILCAKIRRGETIGMVDILEASQKEDPLCVELITKAGNELGRHISSLINIFNPERIVIGGALSRAASYYFLLPIRAAVRKYSLKLISKDVLIETSKMGDEAGVYGACMIAQNLHFKNICQAIINNL